jgi:hypothetical protein
MWELSMKMTYVCNRTGKEQWIVDEGSRVARRVGPGGVARVTEANAEKLVEAAPEVWRRATVIPIGPWTRWPAERLMQSTAPDAVGCAVLKKTRA